MTQCNALTASDTRCRMAARKDTEFCISHDPAYASEQEENRRAAVEAATRSRRMAPITFPPHATFRSRAGLQVLLDATYRLLLSGELSEERARLLLRNLSLGVRNFDRVPRTDPAAPAIAEHPWPEAADLEHVMLEAIDSSVQHRRYEQAEKVSGERMAREQKSVDMERWPVLNPRNSKRSEFEQSQRQKRELFDAAGYDSAAWHASAAGNGAHDDFAN